MMITTMGCLADTCAIWEHRGCRRLRPPLDGRRRANGANGAVYPEMEGGVEGGKDADTLECHLADAWR